MMHIELVHTSPTEYNRSLKDSDVKKCRTESKPQGNETNAYPSVLCTIDLCLYEKN